MDKKYLKEPGTYEALIIATEAKQSKAGDPMLVVTFKQVGGDAGEINAYFVPKFEFMAKRLAKLKTVIGVSPTAKKEDMLGKRLQIAVRLQEVKPGKERINEKTGLPYPPSSEVFDFAPVQEVAEAVKVFGDLPF